MHDQWIGLRAEACLRAERRGRVCCLDEPLILWRRHGAAQTARGGSVLQKIAWRSRILRALAEAEKQDGGKNH